MPACVTKRGTPHSLKKSLVLQGVVVFSSPGGRRVFGPQPPCRSRRRRARPAEKRPERALSESRPRLRPAAGAACSRSRGKSQFHEVLCPLKPSQAGQRRTRSANCVSVKNTNTRTTQRGSIRRQIVHTLKNRLYSSSVTASGHVCRRAAGWSHWCIETYCCTARPPYLNGRK